MITKITVLLISLLIAAVHARGEEWSSWTNCEPKLGCYQRRYQTCEEEGVVCPPKSGSFEIWRTRECENPNNRCKATNNEHVKLDYITIMLKIELKYNSNLYCKSKCISVKKS